MADIKVTLWSFKMDAICRLRGCYPSSKELYLAANRFAQLWREGGSPKEAENDEDH